MSARLLRGRRTAAYTLHWHACEMSTFLSGAAHSQKLDSACQQALVATPPLPRTRTASYGLTRLSPQDLQLQPAC